LVGLAFQDGPGIRTTVFFKGCSLRCAWCHNPEGIDARPQIQWLEARCIDCHACIDACPRQALSAGPAGIAIDRNLCDGYGACAAACPTGAMELLGRSWTAAELMAELALERWQLCAFNRLCRDKYRRLGLNWAYDDAELIPAERMAQLCEAAHRWGPAPGIVSNSGTLGRGGGGAG
jgi:pyruvate-formate lyase-activating enzyme